MELFIQIAIDLILVAFYDIFYEVFEVQLLNLALIDNCVERIPHLMRNGGINQTQHFIFSLLVVEQYLLRNIHQADHDLIADSRVLVHNLTFLYLKEIKDGFFLNLFELGHALVNDSFQSIANLQIVFVEGVLAHGD